MLVIKQILALGILISSSIVTEEVSVEIANVLGAEIPAALRSVHFLIFWSLVIMATEAIIFYVQCIDIIKKDFTKSLLTVSDVSCFHTD